jgi:ubiquitin-like-conjugating enzyme ATG3
MQNTLKHLLACAFPRRQNKQPLTPTQVFQDVPSDHAFKTMTMETFPHSGQLLASVHPCKHASVMKKFIDRMDDAKKNSGDNINNNSSGSGSQEDLGSNDKDKADKKKKGWGLGGVVRKVTGGSGSAASAASAGTASSSAQPNKQEEVQGVQVDFYMVIVSISLRSHLGRTSCCGKEASC